MDGYLKTKFEIWTTSSEIYFQKSVVKYSTDKEDSTE